MYTDPIDVRRARIQLAMQVYLAHLQETGLTEDKASPQYAALLEAYGQNIAELQADIQRTIIGNLRG